jgi:hypothetical protein
MNHKHEALQLLKNCTIYGHFRDMCQVRTENGHVLGMRAPCEASTNHRTQAPKTCSLKDFTRPKDMVQF